MQRRIIMQMNRALLFVLLAVVSVMPAALAQEPTPAADPNRPMRRIAPDIQQWSTGIQQWTVKAKEVFDHVMSSSAAADPTLCAVVVLPGPAESVNIRFGVFNVAADRLDVLIMDSFRALGGQSLLHESVFDTVAPASGTLAVEFPSGVAGKGPVVLSFTDFTQFESAAFNTDPDTYDDPLFGATVEDLDQTVIELVYSSDRPGSRRCQGTLEFDAALNASVANIVQVFP
jgi:hypothetical protein